MTTILEGIPILILCSRTFSDNIPRILGIRLQFEPTSAEVAFATEGIDRCTVIIPDLLLFTVVAYSLAYVSIAMAAPL